MIFRMSRQPSWGNKPAPEIVTFPTSQGFADGVGVAHRPPFGVNAAFRKNGIWKWASLLDPKNPEQELCDKMN